MPYSGADRSLRRSSRPVFDKGGRLSDSDITNVAAYVITTSSEGWD